mmetsp:Transcript_35160/g.89855  ORF Transcript_35160/g.89855 Transcript_35160/m.89855 type:complete len:276 (-) Transcript_35160:2695-3522(-)
MRASSAFCHSTSSSTLRKLPIESALSTTCFGRDSSFTVLKGQLRFLLPSLSGVAASPTLVAAGGTSKGCFFAGAAIFGSSGRARNDITGGVTACEITTGAARESPGVRGDVTRLASRLRGAWLGEILDACFGPEMLEALASASADSPFRSSFSNSSPGVTHDLLLAADSQLETCDVGRSAELERDDDRMRKGAASSSSVSGFRNFRSNSSVAISRGEPCSLASIADGTLLPGSRLWPKVSLLLSDSRWGSLKVGRWRIESSSEVLKDETDTMDSS